MTTAMVGHGAPDFDLPRTASPDSPHDRARLDDYRGRWLVVAFYPRDFSLVCPTELTSLGDQIEEFDALGADVLGISTDSVESHDRWIAMPRSRGGLGGLAFPLASDTDGSASRSYGVYLEGQHAALRGLFIVDPNGVLQYQVVHNMSVGRRVDEVLRVLAALQTGGLCGEGWSRCSGELIDPTTVLEPGRVISHYRIESVIGTGTFATVYRARDLTLDRDVALKLFKGTDPVHARAAVAEARAAASLSHPNICTIFAVEDDAGASMIAMEYVGGRTLADVIASGPVDPEWAGRIAWQVAAGMASAHRRGLVHGDLKPANVMVTECGTAKVLDFGLARREAIASIDVDLDATVDGEDLAPAGISGTPSYMAPEQARGEPATAASDVFALGVIIYEMLTGRKAFPGVNLLQVLNQIARVDPDRLADGLAEPFDEIVRRALAPEPADRTIGMAELAQALSDPACPFEAVPG